MASVTINRADVGRARGAASSVESSATTLRSKAHLIAAQIDRLYWTGPIRDRIVPAQLGHAATLHKLAGEADSLADQLRAGEGVRS